jgi:hypothetical protein
LHQEGKTSSITLPRIQALECLGFEWKPISRRHGRSQNSNLDDDVTSARVRAVESIGAKQPCGVKMLSMVEKSAIIKSTSLSNPKNTTGRAESTSTLCQVEVDEMDSLYDERDLDGSPSKQDMMQETWLASYGTIFG